MNALSFLLYIGVFGVKRRIDVLEGNPTSCSYL